MSASEEFCLSRAIQMFALLLLLLLKVLNGNKMEFRNMQQITATSTALVKSKLLE